MLILTLVVENVRVGVHAYVLGLAGIDRRWKFGHLAVCYDTLVLLLVVFFHEIAGRGALGLHWDLFFDLEGTTLIDHHR